MTCPRCKDVMEREKCSCRDGKILGKTCDACGGRGFWFSCVRCRGRKNYEVACMVCEAKPTVGDTELCGPCCFGEAETIDGNW